MRLLQYIQIIISVALIAVILMQNRGSGVSGIFGGGDGVYRTKRGLDKTLFKATIVLVIFFFGISIATLFV